MSSFLEYVHPQGIYQTLYEFYNIFGSEMGTKNTSPWTQGSPLVSQIPGGPKPIELINVKSEDLSYPKSWGNPNLRGKIADYYNHYYGSNITMENVMVFAGGRPGLLAVLMFLSKDVMVRVSSTEYTPYYDILEFLKIKYLLIDSSEKNFFKPSIDDLVGNKANQKQLVFLSNPSNPTGITKKGDTLKELVERSSFKNSGLLIDEAYEIISNPPVSAMSHIKNINNSNLFVCGAATKGLQAPGIRVGWVIASKNNIDILGNFSSFGIGGVSKLSQIYTENLLDRGRTDLAHSAIPKFYDEQRLMYADAFNKIGLDLFSGSGGFYHWCKLKNNKTAADLNRALFKSGAAILKGNDCDMKREGDESSLRNFFRFSFGSLDPNSFKSNIEILTKALATINQ